MTRKERSILASLLALVLACLAPRAGLADSDDAAFREALVKLGASSRSTIIDGVGTLAELNDGRAIPALEALADKRLRSDGAEGLFYYASDDDEVLLDAFTGEPVANPPSDLDEPRINNRVRRELKPVIAQLQLRAEDPAMRLSAARELRKQPNEEARTPITRALEKETDPVVRETLAIALAQIDLADDDKDARLAAIAVMGETSDRSLRSQLQDLLATDADGAFSEPDEDVRAAAQTAVDGIERRLFLIDTAGNFFYGLSLASVLLLAALGLAITFGLMGVINMAHGEMLMVGAYTTYSVLGLFQTHLPDALDWYLVASIPAAFVVCALLGMALERSVIRFLYGRPLETLLATWGISLILIQTVRLLFGAQNVEVANPAYMSGGYEILRGVVLPYSRIAIVLFAAAMVVLVYGMLQRTNLGLWVRAVTQNRAMAGGLGISTSRVDMLTFGLGSGIAGLGGVALSQIGNVGPELGQGYIVDSFMVVVLGGVGKIAGTVVAALGLGILNKLLEPVSGAVLGKIFLLGFLILFIQVRPQGIFALRGRAAEG